MKFELPNTALFTRSFAVDSRNWQGYAFRLISLVLILFFLVQLAITARFSALITATGLRFFEMTSHLNLVIITLIGISLFASAITEEKEVDSLGLLLMTGIGPFSMLISKSTSKMLIAMMLIITQLPFTLLAIPLGGISISQVIFTYITILTYTFLVANIALLFSVIAPRTSSAGSLTLVVLMLMNTIAPIWNITSFLSPFVRLNHILKTGFAGSELSVTEIFYLLFGLIFFLISLALFNHFSRLSTYAVNVEIPRTKATKKWFLFRPGRAWKSAVAWKDFHFYCGGFTSFLSIFLINTIVIGAFIAIYAYTNRGQMPPLPHIGYTLMIVGFVFLLAQGAYLSGTMFSKEVHEKTHSTLMLLPMTINKIVAMKIYGGAMAMIPMGITFIIGFCLLDGEAIANIFGALLISLFAFVPLIFCFYYLTAYLSLYIRHGAVALTFLIFLFLQIFISLFTLGCFIFPIIINGVMIIILHKKIEKRLVKLAGE